jgi:hypothetical protein
MSNGSKVSGVDGRLTPIAFGGAGMVLVLAAPAEPCVLNRSDSAHSDHHGPTPTKEPS